MCSRSRSANTTSLAPPFLLRVCAHTAEAYNTLPATWFTRSSQNTLALQLTHLGWNIVFRPSTVIMDSLCIGQGNIVAKVDAVVLLSIVNHYQRRSEGQERIIGTLLGTRAPNGDLDITACFPVPHNETEDQVQRLVAFNLLLALSTSH